MPDLFAIERSAIGQVLIVHPPTGVAAFDDIDPPRAVAAVGVVVAGEEIAVIVEGEFLRIAQARRDDFQVAAIGLAAKDAARVRIDQNPCLPGFSR